LIGQVAALVGHFFDIGVTKIQPCLNGIFDHLENLQDGFVEENHATRGSETPINAFTGFATVSN